MSKEWGLFRDGFTLFSILNEIETRKVNDTRSEDPLNTERSESVKELVRDEPETSLSNLLDGLSEEHKDLKTGDEE